MPCRGGLMEALAEGRVGRSQGLPVEPAGGTVFRVGSSDRSSQVDVAVPECFCPDVAQHRDIPGFACKYILAVRRACGRPGLAGVGSGAGERGGCGAG